MKTQQLLELAVPESASELVSAAIELGDIYGAAAVYGLADKQDKRALAQILCGRRRDALKLARWEHTPAAVLALLAGLEDDAVTLRIEKNPGTQSETLADIFSTEDNEDLIGLIARHSHATNRMLRTIAEHVSTASVIRSVAKSVHADSETLTVIERRFGDKFDAEIASHANTSPELLKKLYRRGNSDTGTGYSP